MFNTVCDQFVTYFQLADPRSRKFQHSVKDDRIFFDTASSNLFTLSCNLDEQVENRFFMAKQTERG